MYPLFQGYASLDEMYKKSSCVSYWDNIKVPMVFVNAVDDPIVPPSLLRIVRTAAGEVHSLFFLLSNDIASCIMTFIYAIYSKELLNVLNQKFFYLL